MKNSANTYEKFPEIAEIENLLGYSESEIKEKVKDILKNDGAKVALSFLDECMTQDIYPGLISFLQGLCLKHLGDYEQSELKLIDSILMSPAPSPVLLYETADTQLKAKKIIEATNTLSLLVSTVTNDFADDPQLEKQVGSMYYKLGLYLEAINNLESYCAKIPSDIHALEIWASSLERSGNALEALKIYKKVIGLGSESAQIHRNIAVILNKLDHRRLALKHLEKAANLDNDYNDPCNKLMCAASTLQFKERSKYTLEALNHNFADHKFSDPFPLFFCTDDPRTILEKNSQHAKKFECLRPLPPLLSRTRKIDEKIIIGYLSADFNNHATTYLIEALIRMHDRSAFHVLGFDFSLKDRGPKYHDIQGAFDEVINIADLSDQAAAEVIRKHSVDILIELKGYTRHSRPGIVGYRPAPIQVNYLGYPGTMGNPAIDYIIGDAIVTPESARSDFSEKVIELSCCYQPNNNLIKLSSDSQKSEHNLPENTFIFCCFNNHWKWSPEVLVAWSEILKACPESVLWVLAGNEELDPMSALKSCGVDSERVVLAPMLPINQHLERIRHADLFLDTSPCGGHTTASDAIRAGVPVLCISGASFHSRVSESIMSHAGCREFVCGSISEYVAKATRFYEKSGLLTDASKKLLEIEKATHPFNTLTTVRQVEAAYKQIIDQYPLIDHIKVPASVNP